MKSSKNAEQKTKQAVQAVVTALVAKKEMKTRLENGENLRKVAKENGLKVVLPL